MATSREERMQERMRGAGRHEVADESFGLLLPVEDNAEDDASEQTPPPTPAPVSATRSTPNTSAKRRHLDQKSKSPRAFSRPNPVSPKPKDTQPPSSASRADPYDLEQEIAREESPVKSSLRRRAEQPENDEDDLGALPEPVHRPSSRSSTSRLSAGPHVTEEVTESPANAPGSGHRRRVRISDVTTQSAQLQKLVMDAEAGGTGEITTSSPLTRKSGRSLVTPSALSMRSVRTNRPSALAKSSLEVDELSPPNRPPRKSNSTMGSGSARSSLSAARRSTLSTLNGDADELSSPVPLVETRRKAQAKSKASRLKQRTIVNEDTEETRDVDEPDEAEEIGSHEAAQRIGGKRSRPSPPRGESPELDSRREDEAPLPKKRRQKRSQASPAKQSQPKPNKRRRNEDAVGSERQRSGDGEHIPVTVQRYTQPRHYNEDDTDADILSAEIPFANRGGVNVVDVLAQMCDEVIDANLATLHEAAIKAEDTATKREYKTKLRALEAFQEELRTRLLEHTIALDTLHALKKRVRSVQKQRLALRSEIIRIRAEKEQVALRMDTVRIRHETDSKRSLDQLNLSATMHDIDLVVERGRDAPELTPKEQKDADLANLELLVSRVADQAARSGSGGSLKQIQEFNSFLERAATALETK